MDINFSLIIPVYDRPEEIRELLESVSRQSFQKPFEVVIVEDGSYLSSEKVVRGFLGRLQVSYYKKLNTGPGDSRNYGMHRAKGNYYIVLDSDCILPSQYLKEVSNELQKKFVHCFGGPDAADRSFTNVQKAIDYVMTSFFTTGGIRGGERALDTFQPRSFNMGISKEAFEKTGGFGQIHPGEDPDLTFRIWKSGFDSRLFINAFVYHKRRIDWSKFFVQMNKFGKARAILNKWHPNTARLTYWFPTLFITGLFFAIFFAMVGYLGPLSVYGLYFLLLFLDSLRKNRNLAVAFLTLFGALIQFFGYGTGFLKSTILVNFSHKKPEELFPKLFFKKK